MKKELEFSKEAHYDLLAYIAHCRAMNLPCTLNEFWMNVLFDYHQSLENDVDYWRSETNRIQDSSIKHSGEMMKGMLELAFATSDKSLNEIHKENSKKKGKQ